ncbi:MAG: hypothetical protein KJ721_01430, partial [Nanoarchaeota archaeon]|nr:hypothetical protein [Nanoarchaeota archaeon]
MSELPEIEIVKELKKIFQKGFIKSMRSDNTGIGYTLETLLKIKENNIGEPDFKYNKIPVELKSQREKASSRVTLMTKTPHWNPLKPKEIMEKFGYKDIQGRQGLKITLTANNFNAKGFKLEVDKKANRLNIIHKDYGVVAYFDVTELMDCLKKKIYQNLCLVLAEVKKINKEEYFKYKKAILLKDLSEESFENLFNDGLIVWEFRMHIKESKDATTPLLELTTLNGRITVGSG